MIFNTGDNEVTANKVKYGESNVAQALDTLADELTANNTRLYMDYKNGKYGYNTDPLRGADTFNPFNAGAEFPNINTVFNVRGNAIPTIRGNGYIILRYMSGNNDTMYVYIDGNTQAFTVNSEIRDGYHRCCVCKFYFQESISIRAGQNTFYYYQTLLADSPVQKRYSITQGLKSGADFLTITGKGKILISSGVSSFDIVCTIDGGEQNYFRCISHQYMEFNFNESFSFRANLSLYYIAYVESE